MGLQRMLPALLTDENVPSGTVAALREMGFDVLAVGEQQPRAFDRMVITLARNSGRWLVTFDRDYGELIFKRGEAPPVGILFLRQRPRRAPDFESWIRAALESDALHERLKGHLAVLDGRKVRLSLFSQSRIADP